MAVEVGFAAGVQNGYQITGLYPISVIFVSRIYAFTATCCMSADLWARSAMSKFYRKEFHLV
jgi:hypothetical protein